MHKTESGKHIICPEYAENITIICTGLPDIMLGNSFTYINVVLVFLYVNLMVF